MLDSINLYQLVDTTGYAVSALVAALISLFVVRQTIFITRKKKLFDQPDNTRKIHGAQIPSMGGIGIFAGYLAVSIILKFNGYYFIPVSTAILFFTGIYDDIRNMRPFKKLLVQLGASAITMYCLFTNVNFYNGLYSAIDSSYVFPQWFSIAFFTVFCTFFINAFNFIDGIDGLACTMAIFVTFLIGVLFGVMHEFKIACILFSLMGATAGLLYFNRSPAKIYMGDTGSMLLGFNMFVFSLIFLGIFGMDNDKSMMFKIIHTHVAAFPIIISMLFLPMFDAVRVFIVRASRGISPLKADRSHLHYYLLDAGFTHSQSVLILLASNLVITTLAWLMQDLNPFLTFLAMLLPSTLLLGIIWWLRLRNAGNKIFGQEKAKFKRV